MTTPQDVVQHGALVLVEPSEAYQAEEDGRSVELENGEQIISPIGVEPSDVWSREPQHASSVVTGSQLLQVLFEYGQRLISSLKSHNPKAWSKIKMASLKSS